MSQIETFEFLITINEKESKNRCVSFNHNKFWWRRSSIYQLDGIYYEIRVESKNKNCVTLTTFWMCTKTTTIDIRIPFTELKSNTELYITLIFQFNGILSLFHLCQLNHSSSFIYWIRSRYGRPQVGVQGGAAACMR